MFKSPILGFNLKKILYFLGSMLGLAGIIFVFFRLGKYIEQVNLVGLGVFFWGAIAFLVLLYGFSNFFLVRAWSSLLSFLGVAIRWDIAAQVYGRSQLAKYVPGNIFHLAGRQALGMAHGLPAWVLAKSVAWEIGLIVVVGIPFFLLALPLYFADFSVWLSLALFIALTGGMFLFFRRWSSSLADAFIFQTIFLIVSGLVFVGVLFSIAPGIITLLLLPAFCGSYIIAWLAGLVTPGAPAGTGIRELVLLFLLSNLMDETTLLLAVVIGRIVTIMGDFLFFLVVSAYKFEKVGTT